MREQGRYVPDEIPCELLERDMLMTALTVEMGSRVDTDGMPLPWTTRAVVVSSAVTVSSTGGQGLAEEGNKLQHIRDRMKQVSVVSITGSTGAVCRACFDR